MSRQRMRARFDGMHSRCYDPSNDRFTRYGGRGIYVCQRWHSFDAYYADMGDPPGPNYSVDRIDNDGPYAPENCRWATSSQQARNRRDTHKITVDGVTQSLTGWSESSGIPRTAIRKRLKLGWPEKDAVTIPITTCGYRRKFHKNKFKGEEISRIPAQLGEKE
jgi:hypothetical protein